MTDETGTNACQDGTPAGRDPFAGSTTDAATKDAEAATAIARRLLTWMILIFPIGGTFDLASATAPIWGASAHAARIVDAGSDVWMTCNLLLSTGLAATMTKFPFATRSKRTCGIASAAIFALVSAIMLLRAAVDGV